MSLVSNVTLLSIGHVPLLFRDILQRLLLGRLLGLQRLSFQPRQLLQRATQPRRGPVSRLHAPPAACTPAHSLARRPRKVEVHMLST